MVHDVRYILYMTQAPVYYPGYGLCSVLGTFYYVLVLTYDKYIILVDVNSNTSFCHTVFTDNAHLKLVMEQMGVGLHRMQTLPAQMMNLLLRHSAVAQ